MTARRTASQIATLAALVVASFGGTLAHSAESAVSSAGVDNVLVFIFGGRVFTIPVRNFSLSGVSQMGGGG